MKSWKNGRPNSWKNPFNPAAIEARDRNWKPISHSEAYEAGADAMLKRLCDWGYEHCEHDPENLQAIRAYCPVCWQELLEEVK